MNRYQREVEEMDRQFDARVRVVTVAGVAAVVAAAFWGAGFPSIQWIKSFYAELTESGQKGEASDGGIGRELSVAAAQPANAEATETNPASPLASGNESSVSSTRQALFLVSANPGRNAREGTARIGTNPENPQTYVAGAILANGARLAEVHSTRVVIERGNKRLTLHLSKDTTAGLTERSEGETDLMFLGGAEPSVEPRPVSSVQLTDVIRAMPLFEADQLRGLQVYAGRQSSTFAQLGLRPGDLITAVDGVVVTDPMQSLQSLDALIDGAAMVVSVERGTETLVLSLDGALVSKMLENRSIADATLGYTEHGSPH